MTIKNLKLKMALAVITVFIIAITPLYLDQGGFYFDDHGLSMDNFRFRSPTKQAFRLINDSERHGDIVIWYRFKGENVCSWVFQMHANTYNDLNTQCPGLQGKDFYINYEWAASNPRLASEAQRLGHVDPFF